MCFVFFCFFFKHKTAYELRIRDWSSDVCSSDLRFIIAVPLAPYRCPPAPYERACLVADYFKRHKPRSTVHIFDANADVTSQGAMFKAAWEKYYAGMIEYVPQFKAVDADAAANKVIFEFGEEEKADVVNLVPPMRAGRVAAAAGLVTARLEARRGGTEWVRTC